MYGGRIVEQGSAAEIYRTPSHPYTIGLLNSVPRLDRPRSAPLDPIPGSPPDPLAPPSGCSFRPRCRLAAPHCAEAVPPLRTVTATHRSACFELQRLGELLVPACATSTCSGRFRTSSSPFISWRYSAPASPT